VPEPAGLGAISDGLLDAGQGTSRHDVALTVIVP
jgi:hypothetical protein